jgi:hypothetical protein
MNAGYVGKVVMILPLLAAVAALGEQPRPEEDDEARAKRAFAHAELTAAALPAEFCFTSGSATAPDYMKFCLSPRGNITRFESPLGFTHIEGSEGYVVCVDNDRRIAVGFDAGLDQAGWQAPTVSQPSGAGTLPLIVTRTSEDGRVQLKQTFNRNAAERSVEVKMDVKSLSAVALPGVLLHRYFDADVDGSASDDFWDRSGREAVWAKDEPQGTMLLLTAPAPAFGAVVPFMESFADWSPFGASQSARACSPLVTGHTALDGVGRVERNFGVINPGVTKSVTFRYRRY